MKELQKQYSLLTILILWLLVTLPMGIFRFILMPYVAKVSENAGIIFWILMVLGMIWQFVLSLIILKHELGSLEWQKIKERLWLNPPRQKKDGKFNKKILLLTIPFIIYSLLISISGLDTILENGFIKVFPSIAPPAYSKIQNLALPRYHGAWPLMVLAIVSSIFNYLLGEELFFRGILLPKMKGVFGKYDWLANGIFFAIYHVHLFSTIPILILDGLFIAFLNKRHKSFYPALIMHGVEAIPLLASVTWVIWFM